MGWNSSANTLHKHKDSETICSTYVEVLARNNIGAYAKLFAKQNKPSPVGEVSSWHSNLCPQHDCQNAVILLPCYLRIGSLTSAASMTCWISPWKDRANHSALAVTECECLVQLHLPWDNLWSAMCHLQAPHDRGRRPVDSTQERQGGL